MANYKNGTETKTSLYSSAKKLFYLKGYGATTIKDIITDAESKLGLFTYYFEGKESVAISIFKDFVNDIALVLEEPLKDYTAKNDYLLVDMIEYRAYFECINANEQIKQFYKDISILESFAQMTIDLKDYFIQKRFENGLKFETSAMIKDKTYFDAIASLTSGMEIQFFRDVLGKKIDIAYGDAIDIFLTEYYRFLVLDKKRIQDNLRKSRKVVETLHFEIGDCFSVQMAGLNP